VDEIQSIRSKSQDFSHMLSAQQRARVREEFDPRALEVFLQWIDSSIREEFLGAFQYQDSPGEGRYLTGVDDPFLQDLLEEVWVPYWRSYPTEGEILREAATFPGREKAIRRFRAEGRFDDEGRLR
jgi:hypothetical protein